MRHLGLRDNCFFRFRPHRYFIMIEISTVTLVFTLEFIGLLFLYIGYLHVQKGKVSASIKAMHNLANIRMKSLKEQMSEIRKSRYELEQKQKQLLAGNNTAEHDKVKDEVRTLQQNISNKIDDSSLVVKEIHIRSEMLQTLQPKSNKRMESLKEEISTIEKAHQDNEKTSSAIKKELLQALPNDENTVPESQEDNVFRGSLGNSIESISESLTRLIDLMGKKATVMEAVDPTFDDADATVVENRGTIILSKGVFSIALACEADKQPPDEMMQGMNIVLDLANNSYASLNNSL